METSNSRKSLNKPGYLLYPTKRGILLKWKPETLNPLFSIIIIPRFLSHPPLQRERSTARNLKAAPKISKSSLVLEQNACRSRAGTWLRNTLIFLLSREWLIIILEKWKRLLQFESPRLSLFKHLLNLLSNKASMLCFSLWKNSRTQLWLGSSLPQRSSLRWVSWTKNGIDLFLNTTPGVVSRNWALTRHSVTETTLLNFAWVLQSSLGFKFLGFRGKSWKGRRSSTSVVLVLSESWPWLLKRNSSS